MIEVTSLCGLISLGKQGENLARVVYFDEPEMWKEIFGEGKCELLHQRNGDAIPYPVALDVEDGKVCWKVTNADTAIIGDGKCELHYSVNGVIVKSKIWTTTVFPSLGDDVAEPPEPQQRWVDEVLSAAEKVESATTHQPVIGENKNWFVWDAETEEYIDSGILAEGVAPVKGEDYWNAADKAEVKEFINEELIDTLEFKGDAEENSLPTENNVKGDVYRLYEKDNIITTEKYLLSGEYVYKAWIGDNDEIISSGDGFDFNDSILTSDEDIHDFEYKNFPVNIYDVSYNNIGTCDLFYAPEIPLWVVKNSTVPLTENETYYVERADGKIPVNLEPTTVEEFEKIIKGYAIYNGESFDKFYNDETVDNKIENAKQWKTLIDTTLTEEQGGVSSIKIEIPEPEILKTITRMRILIDIQAGADGIASQTAKICIGDYNNSAYGCYFGWQNIKCDANQKLMYRGIAEFFPIYLSPTNGGYMRELRQALTFYSGFTLYENANATGNATKIPSTINVDTSEIKARPPYFQLELASGGIMEAGTKIFVEVFE